MAQYSGQHHSGNTQANQLGGALMLWGIILAVMAVIQIFTAVPVIFALLREIFLGSWPEFGEIVSTAVLGALAGLITGLLRFWRKKRSGVVDELIATAASPDTLTAWRLGVTAVGFNVALGVFGGAVVGAFGASPFHLNADAALGLAVAGGLGGGSGGFSGGGSGGDGVSLLTLFIAVVILIVVITLLFSLGVGVVGFSVAKSAALGGVAGGARGLGELAALALTRLRTVQLTYAARAGPAGPIATDTIIENHLATISDLAHRATVKKWIDGYERWLSGLAQPPAMSRWTSPVKEYVEQTPEWREYGDYLAYYQTLPRYKRHSPEWVAQHDQRVQLRLLNDAVDAQKSALEHYATTAWEVRNARDPNQRMQSTNGAPAYDGTRATLFYPGALKAAVGEATMSGLYSGAVTAAIACVLIAIRR